MPPSDLVWGTDIYEVHRSDSLIPFTSTALNTLYCTMSTPEATPGTKGNFIADLVSGKTNGVKNIEAAYSRAGASANHTPGAASKLGSQDQAGASEKQGVGSEKFTQGISDQRQEPSVVGKMFNNIINGTDSSK